MEAPIAGGAGVGRYIDVGGNRIRKTVAAQPAARFCRDGGGTARDRSKLSVASVPGRWIWMGIGRDAAMIVKSRLDVSPEQLQYIGS
jgi:hypothetical protein